MILHFQPAQGDGPEGQIDRIKTLEVYVAYLNGFLEGFVENVEKETAFLRQQLSVAETRIYALEHPKTGEEE